MSNHVSGSNNLIRIVLKNYWIPFDCIIIVSDWFFPYGALSVNVNYLVDTFFVWWDGSNCYYYYYFFIYNIGGRIDGLLCRGIQCHMPKTAVKCCPNLCKGVDGYSCHTFWLNAGICGFINGVLGSVTVIC